MKESSANVSIVLLFMLCHVTFAVPSFEATWFFRGFFGIVTGILERSRALEFSEDPERNPSEVFERILSTKLVKMLQWSSEKNSLG